MADVLHEGSLRKLRGEKDWRNRYVVLQRQDGGGCMLVVSAGKGKKELGRVALKSADVEGKVEGMAHSAVEPSFLLTVGGNVHTFGTASPGEHKAWVGALQSAIS